MTLAERSAVRRQRMQSHKSLSFEEAERWDLEYWQLQTPAAKLEAFMAIRGDVHGERKKR